MTNKNKIYGKIFKELRQGQGFGEREACKGVCSRSALCRFETGKSDIGLSKFVGLMKNTNVSAEEYFATVENFEPSDDEKFFRKVVRYCNKKNIDMLKKMLRELQSSKSEEKILKSFMLSLIINIFDESFIISDQDFKNVSDYLIGIERWSYSKLGILINIIDKLNINLACSITRDLLKIKRKFLINEYRKTQLIKILLNVSYSSCVNHERLTDASVFLKEAEALIATQRIENCIAAKYVLRFIKGFFYLVRGDTEKGVNLMRKAVDNFRTTEDKEIIERYEQFYKEALEQVGYVKSEEGENLQVGENFE
ncbi:MAG: hypothetical protein LBF32_04595 [Streptococcaceae bacterium]|jgi:Rgg/GadR/MutR family transcriptional activator|nr:hypothetical protein [Streptococcaceae bacterium]